MVVDRTKVNRLLAEKFLAWARSPLDMPSIDQPNGGQRCPNYRMATLDLWLQHNCREFHNPRRVSEVWDELANVKGGDECT